MGDRGPVEADGAAVRAVLLELDAEATEALIADYPEVSLGTMPPCRQTVILGRRY